MTKRLAAVAVSAASLWLLSAPLAAAQTAGTVTLASSAPEVDPGGEVTLSGAISPPAAGETVQIADDADAIVAAATTNGAGEFSLPFTPARSVTLRAVWGSAESSPVTVVVRGTLDVRLPPVRLFDSDVVRGSVSPPQPGARVQVELLRARRVVDTRLATVGGAGRFRTTFRIEEPGTYRVRANLAGASRKDAAVDGPRATPLPSLHTGSHDVFVKLLERRLVALHYRLVGVNSYYDYRTADAVVAFRKVQGMSRISTVDAAMWRALADPRIPRPRFDTKRFHFEVDQTRQVLYTVRGGEITNILHVSTGKPSTPTQDGTFSVYSKCPCLTPLGLYYPSFFDGGRALHGYVEVPTYAASHGCVRIPYWNAQWVYGLAAIGTPVMIYH